MRRALARFLVVAAVVLSGCFSPGGTREAQRHFVLEPPAATTGRAGAAREATLLVGMTTAAGFYDTQGIVFSRSPGTRAYYQLSRWTERPSRRIQELLTARLQQSGLFRTVAAEGAGLRGDLVLHTHLEELYHDAAQSPGSVRIVLRAELTNPAQRKLLARRTFTASAPAPSYDAPGAVQAFNQALGAVLDEVVTWVGAP